MRSFLLKTSILGRMTGELCDRLLERSDSQAMLQELETANLFLVPLDEQRRWYRYHHLFAEVLRAHLRQAYPGQLAELHERAAEWYEQNGFVSEAIHHALAVGDQPRAARLIENNALAMLMRGEAVTVLTWIQSIAPLARERPWLGIHQAWAFICTGQFDRIEPLLHETEERIGVPGSDGGADKIRYHIAGIRALAAVRQGAQEAIDLANQALQLLPGGDPAVHSVIVYTLGEASWSTGDLAGARRAFAEASRIDRAAGNLHIAVLGLSGVADLLAEEGKLHSAAETYRAAAQTATRSDGRMAPFATRAWLGLSHVEYEWNDLVSSARHMEQAFGLARRWGNPNELVRAGLMQARLWQAQGDTLGAFQTLREVEELAQNRGVTPPTAHQVDAFRVRLWLAQSNLEAVSRWVGEQTLDPCDEISYWHQTAYLTLARILMVQERADTALTLLERLLEQVEAHRQMGLALEILLLQSLAFDQQNDTPRALAVLGRALMLGQPEGYVRVFLDEGAPMVKLLRQAGSQGEAPKYVARLLSQFDREIGISPARQQPLIEPLTDRELQVLRLMVDGLPNQEIADRLVVALGTIKTHTASLYRKLNVASRSQAAARARDLGLL